MNRALWAVNEGAMKGVVKPTARAYRFFVPTAFRMGISNIGQNLQYPRRIVNNLLQERWAGMRDETFRFLCNSVLGMGGFLNVAGGLGIPVSDADFGQTFGRWGWKQNFYLMLPITGPSSDRDAVGMVADAAVNPLTYFSPYSYIPTGIRYNDLTDAVEEYIRRIDAEMDPYSLLRYGSSLQRKERLLDWKPSDVRHVPSLETLRTVLFGVRDPRFPQRGRTRTVPLPGTTHALPYTLWLQQKSAPTIYILPGIGAHRLNSAAMALAELLYENGFSVVTISSVFNYEFIGSGLSADLPGYAASDVRDIHVALTQIDRQIQKEHPGRVGKRGLMGYSMGGFHAMLLAANAAENRSLLQFDRFLSIDAPVQLLQGIAQLDAFYNAALDWPAAERTDQIEQLVLKVAALSRGDVSSGTALPLSSTESRFLIGLSFRLTLRDVIFFTQLRHNQGVLEQPVSKWKREPVYREIMDYSFSDYLEKFIAPYYLKRGIDLRNAETVANAVDLRSSERALKAQTSVSLIANANDILLTPDDVRWLEQTFGERLTLFPHGGHLGNLGDTSVQVAVVNAFAGLMEAPVRRDAVSVVSISARRGLERR